MFVHLTAMTDQRGLFEHADHAAPRREHGYCTDDNARLLVVASREPDDGAPARLSRTALAFTLSAQAADGRVHNRMDLTGAFTDAASTDDCWGRAVWGWGVAATHHDDAGVRAAARAAFDRSVTLRSPWPRAMAFASAGAAAVAASGSAEGPALELLSDAVDVIGTPRAGRWRWPQSRLSYANAALADAVLAAGRALDRPALVERGLEMLAWLLDRETRDGHLSVTGTGGSDATTEGPQFDQQPIEVAALADACWTAHALTGERRWGDALALAARWFAGFNDAGTVMADPATGAAFDGLTPRGANLNQGAESTLAHVSTLQRAGVVDHRTAAR